MDDIASHLGMSKKTIYLSFEKKEDILKEIIICRLKENQQMMEAISKKSENIVAEIISMMKHMSDLFSKINPLFFYEIKKYQPEIWKIFSEFRNRFVIGMLEKAIQKGKKQGLIRKDIDEKIISVLRIEEMEMGFDPEIFPPSRFNLLHVQLSLTEHFLYGICTLKGHKLINKYKEISEEE
jgi:AcrR family transcriptional regulator